MDKICYCCRVLTEHVSDLFALKETITKRHDLMQPGVKKNSSFHLLLPAAICLASSLRLYSLWVSCPPEMYCWNKRKKIFWLSPLLFFVHTTELGCCLHFMAKCSDWFHDDKVTRPPGRDQILMRGCSKIRTTGLINLIKTSLGLQKLVKIHSTQICDALQLS